MIWEVTISRELTGFLESGSVPECLALRELLSVILFSDPFHGLVSEASSLPAIEPLWSQPRRALGWISYWVHSENLQWVAFSVLAGNGL